MSVLEIAVTKERPAPLANREAVPQLSVIIPFYNEAVGIPALLRELRAVRPELPETVELLLVDDGSTDGTASVLERESRDWPGRRLLRLERNGGQAAALYAGLRACRGTTVALLDGDGQNAPADLAFLLRQMAETGADMVVGVRAERRDSGLRRWMSRVANAVRGAMLRDGVRDAGCGLKVFRREVIEALLPIRTLYSFIPALAVAAGFRIAEQKVHHRPRASGVSNYGWRVMWWRPALDMLGVWWFTRRRFPRPQVTEQRERSIQAGVS